MAEPAEHIQSLPAAEPSAVQLPGRPLGVAHEYGDLIELIRQRIAELGITQAETDLITGLPIGYCGKLLARPPLKKLGALSLSCILGGLGLAIVIVEDVEQTLKIRPRLELRKKPLLSRPHWRYWRKSSAHPASP